MPYRHQGPAGDHLSGCLAMSSRTAVKPVLQHLPPHLREVCTILAAGLVRLRCRTAEDLARDAAQAAADGESSLHFTADQSAHADLEVRATA